MSYNLLWFDRPHASPLGRSRWPQRYGGSEATSGPPRYAKTCGLAWGRRCTKRACTAGMARYTVADMRIPRINLMTISYIKEGCGSAGAQPPLHIPGFTHSTDRYAALLGQRDRTRKKLRSRVHPLAVGPRGRSTLSMSRDTEPPTFFSETLYLVLAK